MDTLTTATIAALLILLASMLSVELALSAAILEIVLGVFASNVFHLGTNAWIDFLAGFAGILLTFLAGAEVDPGVLRGKWRQAVGIGGPSFVVPFVAAGLFAHFAAGWNVRQAEIAGVALSTTSLAVVYAVLVETALTRTDIGKLIMAATFVTDLCTVIALSALFITPNPFLVLFVVVSIACIVAMVGLERWFFGRYGDRVIEPEIKGAFFALFLLMWTAQLAHSQAALIPPRTRGRARVPAQPGAAQALPRGRVLIPHAILLPERRPQRQRGRVGRRRPPAGRASSPSRSRRSSPGCCRSVFASSGGTPCTPRC